MFREKIVDGAYRTMVARVTANDNPSLLLLRYDRAKLAVNDLSVIPRHFFIRDMIEERRPLAPTARRAGWVGCNILIGQVPAVGRIPVIENGLLRPKELVLAQWKQTLFLQGEAADARGWLIDVMRCVDAIGKQEFELSDVYAFEDRLSLIYPNNRHVREKIRQQLQVLRDHGYLDFVSRGLYRLRTNQ